jgi:hypothetical protein
MPFLSREQIMGVSDIVTETVDVPEWGGSVLVRGLTGKERDDFENSIVEVKGKKRSVNLAQYRAKLVALSVVDETGKRLFAHADVEWLGAKSAAALTRVAEVASRLSGLSEDDIEEMTKNSESDQSDDSGSI